VNEKKNLQADEHQHVTRKLEQRTRGREMLRRSLATVSGSRSPWRAPRRRRRRWDHSGYERRCEQAREERKDYAVLVVKGIGQRWHGEMKFGRRSKLTGGRDERGKGEESRRRDAFSGVQAPFLASSCTRSPRRHLHAITREGGKQGRRPLLLIFFTTSTQPCMAGGMQRCTSLVCAGFTAP
jgi:hypothetical protein